LAGFPNCLAEYTGHSLSPYHGLLIALVLLNNVARRCNFICLCAWASEGFYPEGALVAFSKVFPRGAKSGEICFLPLATKKTTLLLKFSNFFPPSNTHACHFYLFFCAVFTVFLIAQWQPRHTSSSGLARLQRLRLRFKSEYASLLALYICAATHGPTSLGNKVVNSGSFLWALSLFIYFRSMSGLSWPE